MTGRSGAALAPLLVPALLALLLGFPSAARAAEADTVLAGSGIQYPGGFDPDTVGEVRGRISDSFIPGDGPVRFRVDTGRERYTVLASPPWYWKDVRVDLPDGSEVRVRGSKTLGKDMSLYVVAQEVELLSSGKSWVFRDGDGHPLWKGRKGVAVGSGMGGASPMRRGGGGSGGGPGGPGGRRR
ncbi:MAG: hypothetical protein AB1346_03760 [Thermodesulfobacteriota bacterium]